MSTNTENCSKLYRRGLIFQGFDFLGKIPGLGCAIGAIRAVGALIVVFEAGIVYGAADRFGNQSLKDKCTFADNRAVDELIRGIYELTVSGIGAEQGHAFIYWLAGKSIPKDPTDESFAHGSRFTVDDKGMIHYYSLSEMGSYCYTKFGDEPAVFKFPKMDPKGIKKPSYTEYCEGPGLFKDSKKKPATNEAVKPPFSSKQFMDDLVKDLDAINAKYDF